MPVRPKQGEDPGLHETTDCIEDRERLPSTATTVYNSLVEIITVFL